MGCRQAQAKHGKVRLPKKSALAVRQVMRNQRGMPGIMPFMPRIILAIPPLENCFITF